MNTISIDEYKICIKNLEKVRNYFGIQMKEIDKHAGLSTNAYSRIVNNKQILKLNELISISNKIYGLKALELLKPNMLFPKLDTLPIEIAKISKARKNQNPRSQTKREIIQYCIIILARYFKPGDEFTNSQIKDYLNDDLQLYFKGKSIEWKKSIISPYIENTKKKQKAKTKSEIVYKLKAALPDEIVNNANKAINNI